MINRTLLIFLALSLSVLTSCKSSRTAQGERDRNIPNLKSKEIMDSLTVHDLRCGWLSIKYEVEIKTDKIEDSFKMYVRMKQDSVIWVSATYYAVEIGRFLLTPDSVKYMDRKNNKYYTGDYDYITNLVMVEANFDLLQSLILGNGDAFVDIENEKVRTAKDNGKYYLSFLRKGQLRRALRKDELKKPIDLVVSLWIEPQHFRVSKTSLYDFTEDRKLTAEYSDFQPACNSTFPYSMKLSANSTNEQAEVKTSVIKLTTDKEVSLSFTIPEKYEPLVP